MAAVFGKLRRFFVLQNTLVPNFDFLTFLSLLVVLFRPNHPSGRSPAIPADGGLRLAMPCWSQVMVSFLLQFPSFVPLFQRDLEGFQT